MHKILATFHPNPIPTNESHPPIPTFTRPGWEPSQLEGQWCHDMANGVGRFQHGDGDAPW